MFGIFKKKKSSIPTPEQLAGFVEGNSLALLDRLKPIILPDLQDQVRHEHDLWYELLLASLHTLHVVLFMTYGPRLRETLMYATLRSVQAEMNEFDAEELYDRFNARHRQYGQFKTLSPSSPGIYEGVLFWEIAKILAEKFRYVSLEVVMPATVQLSNGFIVLKSEIDKL